MNSNITRPWRRIWPGGANVREPVREGRPIGTRPTLAVGPPARAEGQGEEAWGSQGGSTIGAKSPRSPSASGPVRHRLVMASANGRGDAEEISDRVMGIFC